MVLRHRQTWESNWLKAEKVEVMQLVKLLKYAIIVLLKSHNRFAQDSLKYHTDDSIS